MSLENQKNVVESIVELRIKKSKEPEQIKYKLENLDSLFESLFMVIKKDFELLHKTILMHKTTLINFNPKTKQAQTLISILTAKINEMHRGIFMLRNLSFKEDKEVIRPFEEFEVEFKNITADFEKEINSALDGVTALQAIDRLGSKIQKLSSELTDNLHNLDALINAETRVA